LQARTSQLLENIALADDEGVIAMQPDFRFDLSYDAFTLAKLRKDRFDINAGCSTNIWAEGLLFDGEESKSTRSNSDWDEPGWIYLAEGFFNINQKEKAMIIKGYAYIIGGESEANKNKGQSLDYIATFVLAHELKHRYDSMTQPATKVPFAPFRHESSAFEFMYKIRNFYFPNFKK
jgi:hypothetical protein